MSGTVRLCMDGPGLTGRRINNTQRSLSSQQNKPNTHRFVCEHRTKFVCVLVTARCGSKTQAGRLLPGGGDHWTSLREGTSRGGSEPWLWLDHSEVLAGLPLAGSARILCYPCAALHLPGKGPLRRTCAQPPACRLPRACHQSTEPRHRQLMCQQGTDRTMQTGTSTGEYAGVGAGLGPAPASNSHPGASSLRKSLCGCIYKEPLPALTSLPSPMIHAHNTDHGCRRTWKPVEC